MIWASVLSVVIITWIVMMPWPRFLKVFCWQKMRREDEMEEAEAPMRNLGKLLHTAQDHTLHIPMSQLLHPVAGQDTALADDGGSFTGPSNLDEYVGGQEDRGPVSITFLQYGIEFLLYQRIQTACGLVQNIQTGLML